MKKQFQILNIAITIIFFSCSRHNVEIRSTITTGVKELSINSSSLNNEPDLLLIDTKGKLRFIADPRDQAKKIEYRPSAGTASYTIDRSGGTKAIIGLNKHIGVN